MKNNTFCFTVLGNGRKGYIERTIASWEANLIDQPKYKAIFDDSGDAKYRKWLKHTYGDRFDIISIGASPMGQIQAVQTIFNYVQRLDIDYVLAIEEDWMLFRQLNVSEIMSVLDENKNIIQMRIPRTIWHADYHSIDLEAGSLLGHHISLPDTKTTQKDSWYEWRGDFYFWSHNPAVFKKSITQENYLQFDKGDHEKAFGKYLLATYPDSVCGFWAKNIYDGYITHIGFRDSKLLKKLPEHVPSPNQNPNDQIKVGVVIPWREQPSRLNGFNKVVAWYQENLPEANMYFPDRSGSVWSMSGSRNDGVELAQHDKCEVIIVNDADTIPQIEPLRKAIVAAYMDDLMHNPYTEYRALTEKSVSQIKAGVAPEDCDYDVIQGACSGVNVFTPDAWWKLGGNDEKFKGWGYEDTAMRRAHQVINKSDYVAHPGFVVSFYHDLQPRHGDVNFENNKRLYAQYARTNNARQMIQLVKS